MEGILVKLLKYFLLINVIISCSFHYSSGNGYLVPPSAQIIIQNLINDLPGNQGEPIGTVLSNVQLKKETSYLCELMNRMETGDKAVVGEYETFKESNFETFNKCQSLIIDNLPAGRYRTERPIFNIAPFNQPEKRWDQRRRYITIFEVKDYIAQDQREIEEVARYMNVTPQQALSAIIGRLREIQKHTLYLEEEKNKKISALTYRKATFFDKLSHLNFKLQMVQRNLTTQEDRRLLTLMNENIIVEGMLVYRARPDTLNKDVVVRKIIINQERQKSAVLLRINNTCLELLEKGIFYKGPVFTSDQAYPTSPLKFYEIFMKTSTTNAEKIKNPSLIYESL